MSLKEGDAVYSIDEFIISLFNDNTVGIRNIGFPANHKFIIEFEHGGDMRLHNAIDKQWYFCVTDEIITDGEINHSYYMHTNKFNKLFIDKNIRAKKIINEFESR